MTNEGSTASSVPGFEVERITIQERTRDVYLRGEGPAVIVMAEIPGITPAVAAFARRVADAGFSVLMPQLFGKPMRELSAPAMMSALSTVCISHEFRVLAANRSSPVVDWLRGLAKIAHERHGGRGVAAIGMCITGNFGLAMMLDAPVIASVLSQPSLPLGLGKKAREGLHASPEELAAAREKIANDGARVLGLRFEGDPWCKRERFERLRAELGRGFEAIELPDDCANPDGPKPVHSVLTNHLIDEQGQPTRAALDRTISFLREVLVAAQEDKGYESAP
jgi:dienelactone hydrolase